MAGLTSPNIDVIKNVFTSRRERYSTVFFFGFLGKGLATNIEQYADSENFIPNCSIYCLH